ncbi:MAG: cardiolipin synthase ClsB, partial [Betaproteobacteria bacterium]
HMRDFGPMGKQDYAVEVQGPIVAQIHRFVRSHADQSAGGYADFAEATDPAGIAQESGGTAEMIFVTRDNHRHRNGVERHYRAAIRASRERVVLANAYFFPGYRLLRQIRRAARRGVKVTLILQGEPDMAIAKVAARLLYGYLQSAGVQIYEYCERPLHGKVAVVDHDWSTVGSSNLDPTSLTLNLEANLVIRDKAFARHLGERLQDLIIHQCKAIEPEVTGRAFPFWRPVRSFLLFHLLTGYSRWLDWLPRRAANVRLLGKVAAPAAASGAETTHEAG